MEKNDGNIPSTGPAFGEFHQLCRTCLAKGEFTPISKINYQDKPVTEMLQMCASIEVQQADTLPQAICSACLEELIKAYNFIRKCQSADSTLKSVAESAKTVCNANSDLLEVKNVCNKSNAYEIYREVETEKRVPRKFCKDRIERGNHKCDFCGKEFTVGAKLRRHMRSHTKEKPYKCKVCFQAFSISSNLKRHSMIHTGERPHVCKVCGKGFIQATTLHTHEKIHKEIENDSNAIRFDSKATRFHCFFCGRIFKLLGHYKLHLEKHRSRDGFEIKHINDGPKDDVCEICNRAYRSKNLLKAHRLTHEERRFLCHGCGKRFVTNTALQLHIRVHTGEKPHRCNVCQKSFAHLGSFEAHMLTHTGQKPYRCNVCSKTFTQISHVKYHMRTHSGERPYVCSHCGKRFALKGNLTVHIRTHTGETPYLCPVCGKGYYDSSSMKKHQRGHHSGNVTNQ